MTQGQRPEAEGDHDGHDPGESLPVNPAGTEGQIMDQVMVAHASMWSAPLPPPDDLVKYNDAVPDGAERIIAMTERRHAHALETEVRMGEHAYRLARSGQLLGASVAFAVLAVAGLIAWLGATTAAAIVISSTLIGAAGIFVVGKWREQEGYGLPVRRATDDTN